MGSVWLRLSGQSNWHLEIFVQDQVRFSLHVQDGLLDVVEDYLETEKKDGATRLQ